MPQFYKLTIKKIIKETEHAVSISFTVPEHLKNDFRFKAGQYITLKTTINGNEVRRDYSLCSTPKSGELKVAVKEVEDGIFSKFANTTLKTGDVLEIAPPKGRFTFEPINSSSKTIAAFAVGSGITPILSILKTVLEEEANSSFILVYGNKTPKDTMFYNEILELQSNYQNRLNIQFIFSQEEEEEGALFGRIDKSAVNYIVKNKYKNLSIDTYYLCGPEAMINTVSDVLLENKVEKSAINFELFTVSASSETVVETSTDGETKVTIIVDDEEHTFTMPQKQTILEAALDKDIDAPYSCQGGICSSCIAKITEGEATMRQNNILTDGELADGLILTCQAQPTTGTVVVDYDDV